ESPHDTNSGGKFHRAQTARHNGTTKTRRITKNFRSENANNSPTSNDRARRNPKLSSVPSQCSPCLRGESWYLLIEAERYFDGCMDIHRLAIERTVLEPPFCRNRIDGRLVQAITQSANDFKTVHRPIFPDDGLEQHEPFHLGLARLFGVKGQWLADRDGRPHTPAKPVDSVARATRTVADS